MRLPSIKQLPWLIISFFLGLVLIMMVVAETPQQAEEGLFGQLTLKEEAATPTKHQSNYQRIKAQDQQQHTLRYKTKKTKENPFFSFYRQEQKQQQQEKTQAPAKKPQQPPQKDFFSFSNTDAVANKVLFKALFRESQAVQAGKPLRIFLEEPMEALQLKKGTLLKGIPRLAGNRIKIDITAAIMDKQVRPVRLVCFDQEDCLEGLYHDALAARLEEDIKEDIVEALWDIGLAQHEVTRKGGRLAKKLSPKHTENILITSGKALFVMLPEVTSNP